MTDKTQAAKPNSAKLLKDLESKKTEWEREFKVLKAQIEPLREALAGIPLRGDDCTYVQWQQRLQLQKKVTPLEQTASRLGTQLVHLDNEIHRLFTLVNGDKQIAAGSKREQELTAEIVRLREGAERVQDSITDIETKHESAATSADMALQLAVQARARATATGDFLANTAAEKATQEATAERQRAHQAKEHDAPLLTALRAEAEAIDAQITSALKEQEIVREKVRMAQVAKLEDAWDQQAQALVTIGRQLVDLGGGDGLRALKIPNMADRWIPIHYGSLLEDSSVLRG